MARIKAGKFGAGLFVLLWLVSTGVAFEDNKLYTYSYEVSQRTGIDDGTTNQFAVRNFNATLAIRKTSGKVRFQLSELKSDAYNLRNQKTRFLEGYARLDYTAKYGSWNAFLQTPFTVELDNGLISAIEMSSEDSEKQPNIHKAIASLFQTNLTPYMEEDKISYKESEDGIGGQCGTMYHVNRQRTSSSLPMTEFLNVTKIRLYDECKRRPSLFYTSLKGYPCPHCGQKQKHLTALSRTEYQIKKLLTQFEIERIDSTGSITFIPFGIHGQTVSSVVRQIVTLLKVENYVGSTPAMSKPKRYPSLSYVFMKSIQEQEFNSKFASWIHKSSSRDRLADAKEFLGKAARNLDSADGIQHMMRLKNTLQTFDYSDIVQFFGDPANFNIPINDDAKHRRNVLVNVLPWVGTIHSVNFALNFIHLGTVRPNEAEKLLASLPMYIKESSVQLLETFWGFLHVSKIKNQNVFNNGWLSFGTVVYKSCVVDEFNAGRTSGEAYIEEKTCAVCLQKMSDEFRKAKSEPERLTLLRAIKNTRFPSSLSFLFEVLDGKYSVYLRHTALDGISLQINRHKREEISAKIAPVYFNSAEDDIIRIHAFELLLDVYPTAELFSGLVNNLAQETSQQVASYIYSTLTSFVNSTDPCDEKFADHAKRALKRIPQHNYDILTHSLNRHYTYYNAKYHFGRSTQVSILGSNSTVFPREIYVRQGFNLLGYNFDTVEYGIINSNPFYMDMMLLGLREKFGLMPGASNPPKVVKDLRYRKTKIPDSYEFELYEKFFNQDVLLANTVDGLKQSFTADRSNVNKETKNQFRIYDFRSYDATYVIPNELGIPTILSLEMPVHFGASGTADLDSAKASFSGDGKFSLNFVSHAKMSVALTGFSEDGFLLKSSGDLHVPFKGSATYGTNVDKRNLQFKYTPPKEERHRLLRYKSEPITFLSSINIGTPVERLKGPTEKTYKVGHEYFGLGVGVTLQYDDNWNTDLLKSFFHKAERESDYFYLSDKWFAGINGLLDYALLNPMARSAKLEVFLEQDASLPTTEITSTVQTNFQSHGVEHNQKGLDVTEVTAIITASGRVKREWITGYYLDYYWPVKDQRNFKFYFKKLPLRQHDPNEFEVCLTTDMSISNYSEVFNDFLKDSPIPVKLRYDARLVFGTTCATASEQLKVQVVGEKSSQLWHLDRASLPFYSQCEKDIADGFAFSFPCWLAKKHAGRLDKFTVDLQHNNFEASLKDAALQVQSWFRNKFYNNLEEVNFSKGATRENQVQVVANFSFQEPLVDLTIARPDQRTTYKAIYVPAIIPQYQHFTVAENIVERFARNAFSYNPPFCIISGNNVRTFDGVVYQYAVNDCFHVVFSECTKGEVAVLYRRVENNPLYTKAVKLFVEQHVVEMMPNSNDSIAVIVDGRHVFSDDSRIHSVRDRDNALRMHVYRDVDGYVVEADGYDLEFFYNGNDLEFFVSAFYKGKHCGLCGNYDGEKMHEFIGPDGKEHKTVESFAASYAAKGKDNYCN